MTQAYPLHWPNGWPRTSLEHRAHIYSKFGRNLTIAKARERLLNELRLLGARHVVISSNLELRNDGLPRSNQRLPDDSGVAVHFMRDDRQLVMAHDTWWQPEANINALALAISGMRQMERHGGATMLERAFAGFEALPPPGQKKPWRTVLSPSNGDAIRTLDDAKSAYRNRARLHHPDNGGTKEQMAELNLAWEAAQRELAA
jgi:hypothetical protein